MTMSEDTEQETEGAAAGRGSAALAMLKAIPEVGGLPGPAVALIGLGIVAFSGMILLDAVSMVIAGQLLSRHVYFSPGVQFECIFILVS